MLHRKAGFGFHLGLVLLTLFAFSGMAFAIGITGCQEINSSGEYYLQANLTQANISITETDKIDYACIKITTSDLLIDCNGSTMDNDDGGYGPAKSAAFFVGGVKGPLYDNVTIQNCPSILHHRFGVYAQYASNITADNLNIGNETGSNGAGIEMLETNDISITDNKVKDMVSSFGIIVKSSGNVAISGNYVNNSRNAGIFSWNSSDVTISNNAVENIVYGNGFGVQDSAGAHTLIGNNASNTDFSGFSNRLSNYTNFTNNRASDSSGHGFRITNSTYCHLENNWAIGNNYGGFTIEEASGSGEYNLQVEGCYHTLIGNHAHNNTGGGFVIFNDDFNNLTNNEAYHNGAGFAVSGTNNTLIGNNATYNIHNGFEVMPEEEGTIKSNHTFINCRASYNGEDGWWIYEEDRTTIMDSQSDNNGWYGFEVLNGTNNVLSNNEVFDNGYGNFYLFNANITLAGERINGDALEIEGNSSTRVQLQNVVFDNAAGNSGKAVNLSIDDVVASAYTIQWTADPSSLPWNYSVFGGFVDISNSTPGVVVDNITWHWTDAQAAGYNESMFEVWQLSHGVWTKLNFTLDEGNNMAWVENLVVASQYGIMYNGSGNFSALDLYGVSLSNITSHGRFDNGTAQSNPTEGGNITGVAVSSAQLTEKWAAFYGDVVGEIVLRGSAGSNYVYSWAWNATSGGAVCVSTNGTMVSPIIVGGAFGSDIDSAWNFTASDADSGTNTYNNTNCTIDIGSDTVENTSYVDTGAAGGFLTCAMKLADTPVKDEVLFCTEIISGGTAWDGGTADFELMVPTPATPGSTETYYFYANLD